MAWSKETKAKFNKTIAARKKTRAVVTRSVVPPSILREPTVPNLEMAKLQLAHEIVRLLNKIV